MASLILFPAKSVTGTRSETSPPGLLFSGGGGRRRSVVQVGFRNQRLFTVRSALDSLETNVSDMSVNGNPSKLTFFFCFELHCLLIFCAFFFSIWAFFWFKD
jgi:hypothetical protein